MFIEDFKELMEKNEFKRNRMLEQTPDIFLCYEKGDKIVSLEAECMYYMNGDELIEKIALDLEYLRNMLFIESV